MNKTETIKILAVLNAAYPQSFDKISEKVKADMINLWYNLFINDDYVLVGQAVNNYLINDTKGFVPLVGAIKEEIRKILFPSELTEQEAVNIIMDRIQWKSNKEAFDSLPEILKRVVGSPRQLNVWGYMDTDTVQSVVASNIGRSLRPLLEREKTEQRTGLCKPQDNKQIKSPPAVTPLAEKKTAEDIVLEREEIHRTISEAKRRVADAQRQ